MKQVRCHDGFAGVCVVCECVGFAGIAPLLYVGMVYVVSYIGLRTIERALGWVMDWDVGSGEVVIP